MGAAGIIGMRIDMVTFFFDEVGAGDTGSRLVLKPQFANNEKFRDLHGVSAAEAVDDLSAWDCWDPVGFDTTAYHMADEAGVEFLVFGRLCVLTDASEFMPVRRILNASAEVGRELREKFGASHPEVHFYVYAC